MVSKIEEMAEQIEAMAKIQQFMLEQLVKTRAHVEALEEVLDGFNIIDPEVVNEAREDFEQAILMEFTEGEIDEDEDDVGDGYDDCSHRNH